MPNINFGNFRDLSTLNQQPNFIGQAPSTIDLGEQFHYQARATDLDRDSLTYDLPVQPNGMVIDASTGEIFWNPVTQQAGKHEVIVRVQDGRGGVDLQSFQLNVQTANKAPIFTSTINLNIRPQPNQNFYHQATAIDPNNDSIVYGIVTDAPRTPPGKIEIDSQSGRLLWVMSEVETNVVRNADHPWHITIWAQDGKGGETFQTLNLFINSNPSSNDTPTIISTPLTTTRAGVPYFYKIEATDLDGDFLSYSLQNAPNGMTLNNGIIVWTPSAEQSGSHKFNVQVNDGQGGIATQTIKLNVTQLSANYAPSITSVPHLVTNVGREYQYDATGADADQDLLLWRLDQAPAGMVVDSSTGALRWLPTIDQIGNHNVSVQLIDAQGSFVEQSFTIEVTGVNLAPTIRSSPVTLAAQGQTYRYSVVATDPESDDVRFSFAQKPVGMTITAEGQIQWTPQANQVGTHAIEVIATDSQGAIARQSFNLVVGQTAINQSPVITSTPVAIAAVGSANGYTYQVQANDPDGNLLTYKLLESPAGMIIDAATGLVRWTTPMVGNHRVVIGVEDGTGGAAQSFTLVGRANHAPEIRSTALSQATPGTQYRYDVVAQDLDGDRLSYSLDAVSLAKGMTLDALGRLRWTPTTQQVGTHTAEIHVRDPLGASTTQQVNLTVAQDQEAPKVALFASTTSTTVNSTVTLWANATDNVGVTNLQILVDGQRVALDSRGAATITTHQVGTIRAIALATDAAGLTGQSQEFTVTVIDPNATFNPNLNFDLPDVITAPTRFQVGGEGVVGYKLEVSPVGTDDWQTLSNKQGITANEMAIFDPSLLANDAYTVRLSLMGANGGIATVKDTVSVEGSLKLGNFRLSFTDLEIPVSGIPITVTRTYDSLTSRTTDDFGYGWRLEFRDTDLRTSLGRDRQYEETGVRSQVFDDKTRVYITLPGGKREGFTFKPKQVTQINGQALAGPLAKYFYESAFVAEKGSTSTLTVEAGQNGAYITQTSNGKYADFNGSGYNPTDTESGYSGVYMLTRKDGTKYRINAQTGDLLTVEDTNGNKLTYTDNAIASSTGKQVTFERDAQGRIVSVTDPMGKKVKYAYDAQGDLIGVTDRENRTSQLVYNATRPHYLDKIIDPLGHTGFRNEYDELTGQLKQIVDADGKAVAMIYDPNNSIQTVKDQLGRPTTYEYDIRGNIVQEVDPVGKTTKRTYDDNNNILSETIITVESGAAGYTTSYTYDVQGNQISRTNPLNQVDIYTYNSSGKLLSSTNALGYTTSYIYDDRGNVLSKKDAAEHIVSYTYDRYGNALSTTEKANDVTRNEYNVFGFKTRMVDALGNETLYTLNANGNILTEATKLTTPTGVRTLVTTRSYTADGKVKTVRDAEGNLTQYNYDANGNQTVIIDAQGRQSEMKYDLKNHLTETIFPDTTPDLGDNPRIKYEYDAEGNKTAIVNQAGEVTSYSYDALKRPTGMVLPDGTPNDLSDNPKTNVVYTQAGWMKTLVNNGVQTDFEYDAAGNIITTRNTQNGQTLMTRTTYDAAGRKTETTDALNNTTRYVYDAMDRLVETIYADQSSTKTTYDAFGNAIAKTDQAGHTTHYEYDALDRLTGVIDAKLNQIEYKYDEAGNLISQKDANGHETRYEYDGLKHRIVVARPLLQRALTSYNSTGNVIETTDFNGARTTYGYNLLNQLTSKQFVNEGNRTVNFAYTDTGKRATVTDSLGVMTDGYNEWGQLLSRVEPDGKTISYTYDKVTGQVSAITTAAGTNNQHYNGLGQLDRVTTTNGDMIYTYNAIGNPSHVIYSNGVVETYQYDNLNRLVVLENRDASGTLLSRYSYTYDKVGNKTSVLELSNRRVDYTYDELNRLTKETITDVVNGDRVIEYTFDKVGNRLSRNDSVDELTNYIYDDNDRLLTETKAGVTRTYIYDSNGNVTGIQGGEEQIIYRWNTENRLVSAQVTDATDTHVIQYQYDVDGNRVRSTVDGQETRYLVDVNRPYAQVLEEYNSTAGTQLTYAYGQGLISQNRDGNASFYLSDGHSGVRQLTNSLGDVTDNYNYDSYGNLLQSTGTVLNSYRYQGEQFDLNIGMQYLRARYYDPKIGRFVSADFFEGEQELPTSRHRFLYGNDNPLMYTDPSGLSFSLAELGATIGILNELAAGLFVVGYAGAATASGLGALSGALHGFVNWEGFYVQGGGTLLTLGSSPSAAVIGAFAESEPIDGRTLAGGWILILAGVGVSATPAAGLIGNFHAKSPADLTRLVGSKSLAGPSYYTDVTYILPDSSTPQYSSSFFTMGFGVAGASSLDTTIGFSVDISQLVGISINVPPSSIR